MLKIIRSCHEIDFAQLKGVYTESCQARGAENYSQYHSAQQILLAEQDLVAEVKCFFRDPKAFYAIWEMDGCYVSALRMEPYLDGFLLEGLETRPDKRRKGYATMLVRGICAQLSVPIYSHIDKRNSASIAVHLSCGFRKISDCAVYIDGSVSHRSITLKR